MAAHRYWRILCKTNGGAAYVAIGELQMRTSIGGPNVASGGTASSSSDYSRDYPATKAFDGLTTDTGRGDGWACSPDIGGSDGRFSWPWLKYDFGAGNEKDIQEIVVYCPGTGGLEAKALPTSFDWQYSDDGVTWTTQRSCAVDTLADPWAHLSSKIFDVRPLGAIDIHNYALFKAARMHQYVTPGQPIAPEYDPTTEAGQLMVGDMTRYYTDLCHGGPYMIAGTTTSLTNPVARRVRLYHQADGRLHAEQYTGNDGTFEFRNLEIGPWTVIGVDDTGAQNGVIYSHVTAVPM